MKNDNDLDDFFRNLMCYFGDTLSGITATKAKNGIAWFCPEDILFYINNFFEEMVLIVEIRKAVNRYDGNELFELFIDYIKKYKIAIDSSGNKYITVTKED